MVEIHLNKLKNKKHEHHSVNRMTFVFFILLLQ